MQWCNAEVWLYTEMRRHGWYDSDMQRSGKVRTSFAKVGHVYEN